MNDWQRVEALAEKLLGWKHEGKLWLDGQGRPTGSRVPWAITDAPEPEWDPSHHWKDAGQLVELMHRRGTHLMLLYDDLSQVWVAKFPVGLQPAEACYGKTAPEAIVRAAARALGLDEGSAGA